MAEPDTYGDLPSTIRPFPIIIPIPAPPVVPTPIEPPDWRRMIVAWFPDRIKNIGGSGVEL